jgi:hypothetical protein
MTLVPSPDGLNLSLVCDSCGHTVKDIESPAEHWSVVWAVISRTGWTGSPLAIGPHHCAECTDAAVPDRPGGMPRRPGNGAWSASLAARPPPGEQRDG